MAGISVPIMEYIAELLDMPYIRVQEVASFYSMYNLKACWQTCDRSLYDDTVLVTRLR